MDQLCIHPLSYDLFRHGSGSTIDYLGLAVANVLQAAYVTKSTLERGSAYLNNQPMDRTEQRTPCNRDLFSIMA